MDLMMLFLELVANIIILLTKPFSLIKRTCIFGVKSIFLVIKTWIELLRDAIFLHINIIQRLVVWTVAIIYLPAQILTALHRERQMEIRLHEMEEELDTLVWDKKQLKEGLKALTKERRVVEVMLAELEEEHDQAIAKIELLEGELQDLKEENNRIREVQGKAFWSSRDHQVGIVSDQNNEATKKITTTHEISPSRSTYHEIGPTFEDLVMPKDVWGEESKVQPKVHDVTKVESKSSGPIISKNLYADNILEQRRDAAHFQSLFSAILSLLVGMIIWEAQDPCMPLVVALFSVVGMSLKSVVQFFLTIKNKPASDAVALLSFNWFILGTLASPMLPKAACMFGPIVFRVLDRMVRSLGFSLS